MQIRESAVPALCLLGSLLACKGTPRDAAATASAASAAASTAAPLAAAPAPSTSAAPASSVSAAPALTELFLGAPKQVGTTQVPIRQGFAFSGAVALAPVGWTGAEWDAEGVSGPAHSGDVYGDALIFSAADGFAALHYRAERVKAGALPRRPSATELLQHAYPAGIGKTTWETPVEGQVGEAASPAVIWRGTGLGVAKGRGQPWRAYVVSSVVAGKQVLVVGAWDAAHPEHEAAIVEGIKAIRG